MKHHAYRPFICASLLGLSAACSEPPVKPDHNVEPSAQTDNVAPYKTGSTTPEVISTPEVVTTSDGVKTPITDGQVAEPTPTKMIKYTLLFVGGGGHIDVFSFDRATGQRTLLKSNVAKSEPNFIAINAAKSLLYSSDEGGGKLAAYSIDPSSGTLKFLNEVKSSNGLVHVGIDPTGKWLFAASYATGAINSFPIEADGKIGSLASTLTAGVKAHEAVMMPNGTQLLVPCLGSNAIALFDVALNGELKPSIPATFATGSGGPRHISFHPNSKWAFLLNESSNSLQALTVNASGLALNGAAISTLKPGSGGSTAAEVQVHPNGKFVFSSNRGDDSIAIFSIAETGLVTFLNTVKTGGKTPGHFSIDASGKWIHASNQGSDSIATFAVDPATGSLTAQGEPIKSAGIKFAQVVDFYD